MWSALEWNERILPAQTVREGVVRPVRGLLGGKDLAGRLLLYSRWQAPTGAELPACYSSVRNRLAKPLENSARKFRCGCFRCGSAPLPVIPRSRCRDTAHDHVVREEPQQIENAMERAGSSVRTWRAAGVPGPVFGLLGGKALAGSSCALRSTLEFLTATL